MIAKVKNEDLLAMKSVVKRKKIKERMVKFEEYVEMGRPKIGENNFC